MNLKLVNRTVFITSGILIVLHLIPSFVTQAIISTPFLTVGFYGICLAALIKFASVLIAKFSFSKRVESKIIRIVSSVFAVIIMFGLFQDLSLRYSDKGFDYRSYSEKNGNLFYRSPYRFHNLWKTRYDYHPGKPNGKRQDKKGEFQYEYSYNNLGFRNDGEDILPRTSGEHRILAIGDSWTEGIGTPDGQTWTAILKTRLRDQADSINLINIGNSGSDPVYEFYTLNEVYQELQPDEILLTINKSDVNEIIGRGGQERYNKNNKVSLRKGPWWEFIYAGSFLVRRHVRDNLGYTRMLITNDRLLEGFQDANTVILNSITDFQLFCQEQNIDLTVVFVPEIWDMSGIASGNIGLEWNVLLNIYNELDDLGIKSIYLPDCYIEKITDDAWSYWWKNDYHHTPKGYLLMADCLFEEITQ